MNNEENINYNDLIEAGAETPTLDTKSEEDPKLYQDASGKHAKIDTDKGTEGKVGKNKASIAAKASSASGKIDVPHALGTSQERMEQTLEALFDGESLTEEFMVKTATIFEAAINERVGELEDVIVEHYEALLEENIAEVTSELAEKLDDYLGYVVEQWMEQNELSVENGIRADIAENFISGLKTLFDENYIDVPEEKYDLVEDFASENENLKEQLNEAIESNIELRQSLISHRCQEIFFEEADGLVDTDIERFASLSEGIEFENEEQYRDKIQILKESYFGENVSSEYLTEEGSQSNETIIEDPNMSHYMSAISRHSDPNKMV